MTIAQSSSAWLPWITLADSADVLPVPMQYEQARHKAALLSEAWPTTKHEAWKYADLRCLTELSCIAAKPLFETETVQTLIEKHRLPNVILLVSVNGYFVPDLSDTALLPASVVVCNLIEAWQRQAHEIEATLNKIETARHPFASLNAAMSSEGLFIQLPDNCKLAMPLQVLSIMTENHSVMLSPQHHVVLGQHSQMTLIEHNLSFVSHPYFSNRASFFKLSAHAQCTHIKIQQEGVQARQLAHTQVEQCRDSVFSSTQFSIGSEFARDEIVIHLTEPGAACDTAGFYRLQSDNQFVDYHVDVRHEAPETRSDMLYKGIMDKRSRAVFNGRVYVKPQAVKINAHQANHHLLLSAAAEGYSKPELEIYADDVKCKHGSSTGQIDADALFYLRSRGFTHQEALHLLLRAFGENVFARVTEVAIQQRIQEALYS